jgi:hypothetical protein
MNFEEGTIHPISTLALYHWFIVKTQLAKSRPFLHIHENMKATWY